MIILSAWFREGKFIANSEEGLNIYNPSKTAQFYNSVWYEAGTGVSNPLGIVRAPLFFMLGTLVNLGVPIYLTQAFLIGSAMLVGLLGMYFLVKKGLKLDESVAVISALYYLLNLYSMTQIWRRFLYHGMFVWALLPMFILLWIRWVESGSSKVLLILLVVLLVFSNAFGHPASMFVVWGSSVVISLVLLIQTLPFSRKSLGIIFRSLAGLVLWMVTNVWWIYPMLVSQKNYLGSNFATSGESLLSLHSVSKYFPVQEILLLRQAFWMGESFDWYLFYNHPMVYLISVLILVVTVIGIFQWGRVLKVKSFWSWRSAEARSWILITILFIIGLFISKGTNFPLGYTFFDTIFKIFPLSAALRNSYEKFGIVYILAYSIFFSVGLNSLLKSRSIKMKILGSLLLFLSLGLLVNPMWTGSIYNLRDKVEIPFLYQQANIHLNNLVEGRLFHLPFQDSESISYTWGYSGPEYSEYLLDRESISKPLNNKEFDEMYFSLPKYFEYENFPGLLGLLGVSEVVIHRDIATAKYGYAIDLENVKKWKLEKNIHMGDLMIYTLDPKLVRAKIYLPESLIRAKDLDEGFRRVMVDNRQSIIFDKNIDLSELIKPEAIWFEKVSSSKYRGVVRGARGRFVLVLNNTFHPSWILDVGGQVKPIHFLINGFANGWLVTGEGDLNFEITYQIWPWD